MTREEDKAVIDEILLAAKRARSEEKEIAPLYKEYVKRFVNGEQSLVFICDNIQERGRSYYWQHDCVYNLLCDTQIELRKYIEQFIQKEELVSRIPSTYTKETFIEEVMYGKGGVYDKLIEPQRCYNNLKNKEMEFVDRMVAGIICVEDGSVDVYELEEEGICPGKVLIYRQGSEPPKLEYPGTLSQYNVVSNAVNEAKDSFCTMLRRRNSLAEVIVRNLLEPEKIV